MALVYAATAFMLLQVADMLAAGWFIGTGDKSNVPASTEFAGDSAVFTDKSMAVLPFADFIPGSDQRWFADGLARAFSMRDADPDSRLVVQLRQACAEGRDEETNALFQRVTDPTWEWLMLKTLSRDTEAPELLRPLDTPDQLFALSNYLTYTFFDPNDYPLLADTLARQRAQRRELRPIRFACKPEAATPP